MSLNELLVANNFHLKCEGIATNGASGANSVAFPASAAAAGAGGIALGHNASAPAAADISLGVEAGGTNAASTGVLRLAGLPAPAAAAAKPSTHEIPITVNGTVYNVLVSNV